MTAKIPPPVVDGSSNRHRNNLNLCRLIFASLVIFSHVPEVLDGDRRREPLSMLFHTVSLGEVAVAGFFVLSGYLIVQSWLSDPNAWSYLKKRVLRIYPGFIVATLICGLIVGPLAAGDEYFNWFDTPHFLLGMLQLIPPRLPVVFAGTYYPVTNGSMWTIQFEFICYLMVMGFGLLGLLRSKHAWLAATVLSFVLNLLHFLGVHVSVWIFADPLSHSLIKLSMPFLAGGCFYLYRDHIVYQKKWLIASLLLLLAGMFSHVFAELALASVGAYALFYFALTPIPALQGFNKLPDISYGVYLYGWPVMKLILWVEPGLHLVLVTVLTLAISLLFGAASWHLVEKPFMKLKGKRVLVPAKQST